ncbi:TerC family protein [Rhodanobacter sp. 7MK24]|uniref:TerC family protein n=1 Tax=Rhodanobacter sp. 7MK24 TaxID=2775922 RepID=UPI001786EFA6|nr:TerC family protein [Rhodanobacter sp. 7MK24]MBD8882384.1 TerC family protein [Rhodanobacter sp. 7MK24]
MAPTSFLSGLMAIVLLDLVLAGDNAIVIALAARNLPGTLRKRAVLWGTVGAVAVRIVLSALLIWLLRLPGLMLLGGVLLLPIAWKLLKQNDAAHEVSAADGFWSALRTIIVADALMGVDNVLAIAGASHGNLPLLTLGLLISVPLVVWGSTLILRLIERFPVIVYLGAGTITWTAVRMIAHDHLLHELFDAHHGLTHALGLLVAVCVCAVGWWRRHRRPPVD